MSQPSWQPFAMYSSIFSRVFLRLSVGESSSTRKNGQTGRNFFICSGVMVANCSGDTQDASGERLAPLGKMKPPVESNALPRPTRLTQEYSCAATERF